MLLESKSISISGPFSSQNNEYARSSTDTQLHPSSPEAVYLAQNPLNGSISATVFAAEDLTFEAALWLQLVFETKAEDNKGPFEVKATLQGGRETGVVQTEGVGIARDKKRAKQASAVAILLKILERWVFFPLSTAKEEVWSFFTVSLSTYGRYYRSHGLRPCWGMAGSGNIFEIVGCGF
jgi:hypothetical protein